MRECTSCNSFKELDQFSFKDKATGRRATRCKVCQRQYNRNYYINNKEAEVKRAVKNTKERRKRLRDLVNNIKINCNRCNETHIATLQFHHTDPVTKEICIAEAVHRGWSDRKLLQEINKCEILCANCHAKEHY